VGARHLHPTATHAQALFARLEKKTAEQKTAAKENKTAQRKTAEPKLAEKKMAGNRSVGNRPAVKKTTEEGIETVGHKTAEGSVRERGEASASAAQGGGVGRGSLSGDVGGGISSRGSLGGAPLVGREGAHLPCSISSRGSLGGGSLGGAPLGGEGPHLPCGIISRGFLGGAPLVGGVTTRERGLEREEEQEGKAVGIPQGGQVAGSDEIPQGGQVCEATEMEVDESISDPKSISGIGRLSGSFLFSRPALGEGVATPSCAKSGAGGLYTTHGAGYTDSPSSSAGFFSPGCV